MTRKGRPISNFNPGTKKRATRRSHNKHRKPPNGSFSITSAILYDRKAACNSNFFKWSLRLDKVRYHHPRRVRGPPKRWWLMCAKIGRLNELYGWKTKKLVRIAVTGVENRKINDAAKIDRIDQMNRWKLLLNTYERSKVIICDV